MTKFKLIECPRDAMQSIKMFIPTDKKIKYIQSLVDVGFDSIDMGSFVSKKVIPQLKDTGDVIHSLDLSLSNTKLLVVVANIRGAEIAATYKDVSSVGFPFSISENFQMRNTNKTILESFHSLIEIKNITESEGMDMVVYLSMCFGNPYGDKWSLDIINHWVNKISKMGIKTISLSDTIGSSTPESIKNIFSSLLENHKNIEFGAHLHSDPKTWHDKLDSAFKAGCRRFDGAIKGFGGCPMASDQTVGNLPTEKIITYLNSQKSSNNIDLSRFEICLDKSQAIFNEFN